MSIDGEEFIRKIIDGERIFGDVEIENGFDFTPFISKINRELQDSPREKTLMIEDGRFSGIKAEGICLRNLNTLWEPERGLLFTGSNLKKADFRGANLKKSDFTDAELSDACFEDADLEDAVLHHANLAGVKFSNANLAGADLSCANLEGAKLIDANLAGACLANANAHGSDFTGVEFFASDLRDADLSEAVLTCSCGSGDFTDINLERALLRDVEYTHSIFVRAWLKKAVIESSSLYKIDFSDCNTEGSVFRDIYADHLDFTCSNLKGCDFTGSELHFVDFTDANLRDANLSKVSLYGCLFRRTDLRGVGIESIECLDYSLFVDAIVTQEQADFLKEKMKRRNRFIVKEVNR